MVKKRWVLSREETGSPSGEEVTTSRPEPEEVQAELSCAWRTTAWEAAAITVAGLGLTLELILTGTKWTLNPHWTLSPTTWYSLPSTPVDFQELLSLAVALLGIVIAINVAIAVLPTASVDSPAVELAARRVWTQVMNAVSRAGAAGCVAASTWALIHAERSHVTDLWLMALTSVMSIAIASTSAPLGRNRLHAALDRLSLEGEMRQLQTKRQRLQTTLPAPGPWGNRPSVTYACLSFVAAFGAVMVWLVHLMLTNIVKVQDGAWPITIFYFGLAIVVLFLAVRLEIAFTTALTSWTFARSKISRVLASSVLAGLVSYYLVFTVRNLLVGSAPFHDRIEFALIASILFIGPTAMIIYARLPGPTGRRGPGLVALRNICRKWEHEENGLQKQLARNLA